MKTKLPFLLSFLIFCISTLLNGQSIANYSVTRTTAITYNSISASSPSYFAWRNLTLNQDDDNRSYQEPIGFDFWYLGVRYTNFSASLNGTIDFSASTSDGNNGGAGPYGPNYSNVFSTANQSMLALAPLYDDLWTAASGTTPIATSVFYQTSGVKPNRVLTVEWKNFDKWNSSAGSINFQVKIHETTGIIDFLYGTMTAGTTACSYACGINGNWTSGAPAPAFLLTQQSPNGTVFNNTPVNNLSTLPASNSKITFTSPSPSTPGSILFSAVAKTSMSLSWTDNANNEAAYAIYHSTDNINFIYAGVVAANVTTSVITGLLPGTTYYWQVHAATEGYLGAALMGIKATLHPAIIISTASGNWNSGTTWDCNCIPTLGDDVTVANGHTVTLNANGSCNVLTIGQGTSGSLIIGNDATARTLTVDSDIVIHPGAILTTGVTAGTHSIILDDDIINNGTFDLAPTALRVCNITFNNNDDSDQFISGAGSTSNFNRITVNMGLYTNKLEILSNHFNAADNFLTLSNGSFKLSSPANVTPFTGNVTLPIATGIWLNHAGAILSTTGGSITLLGSIQVTSGIFNTGNASDHNLIFEGGSLIIDGGSMNIAGRMDNLGITALTNFAISSGTLTVTTSGSTTAGHAAFSITETGSSFNMSGGTIVIRKPGAGNLAYVNTGGTNGSITAGTLQIGDALTPAGQTFQINSSVAVPALSIGNGVAVTAQLLTNPLSVKNNITINAGTMNSNSINITLGGNLVNNSTFTAGTGTVTFNGSGAQSIGGANATVFYNLTINKTSGLVSLLSNTTVNAALGFISGKISIDNSNLIIGNSGTVSGASASNYAIATGTGMFIQHITNGGSKTFPVGTSSNYIPATVLLTAGSTTDNFRVRVLPLAYSHGESGSVITSNAVSATWDISEEIAGGSNATMTLQWPASLELAGFNRLFSRLAHFTGSAWDYGISDIAASGANPYSITRAGFTSFSPFAISMANVLPVTWLNIEGYHNIGNTYIGWTTASEQNTNFFAIEYSADGIHFLEAGRVTARGTSANIIHYNFIHKNSNSQVLYYRIRQADMDERSSYSRIIKISLSDKLTSQLTIAPNPADNMVNINFNATRVSRVSVLISDISGKSIYSEDKDVQPGNNYISIDMSGQAPGLYLLRIKDGNVKEYINRFIKK